MERSSYWEQTLALIRKNFILAKRNRVASLVQLIIPIVFLLIVLAFSFSLGKDYNVADYSTVVLSGQVETIPTIPRCTTVKQSSCLTLAYTPTSGDFAIEFVMNQITRQSQIPAAEVQGFRSVLDFQAVVAARQNYTQGAYHFTVEHEKREDLSSPVVSVTYAIQYNKSKQYVRNEIYDPLYLWMLPMQAAAETAIATLLNTCKGLTGPACLAAVPAPVTLNATYAEFPHPVVVTLDPISIYGPIFFFSAVMFNFVIQVSQIAFENESRLREGMNQMGLKTRAFWTSWFITDLTWNMYTVLMLIAMGAACQFSFFLKNAFVLYFLLFVLFGFAMLAMALFIATIVPKASSAAVVGFVIFIIGAVLNSLTDQLFSEDSPNIIIIVFSLMPFIVFSQGLSILGDASASSRYSGFGWAQRNVGFYSLQRCWIWLTIDFFIYFFLALYLDQVLPNKAGVSQPFYFFLQPSWYGFTKKKGKRKPDSLTELNDEGEDQERDTEVVAEERAIAGAELNEENSAVLLQQITKSYTQKKLGCFPSRGRKFYAVRNLSLAMRPCQLFCLLGHNGAGKTTTFNMLTGLFPPSTGDAYVYGMSILHEMPYIQRVMGVCPQHDLLYPQLSGVEHLELFGVLKGVPKETLTQQIDSLLEEVDLTKWGNVPCNKYSGGMRRRLSVTISLIGDPRIIFLDEPTTGMDPISRRQVWNLIERVKKDRVIVLTTHSMEEADILGDRIGIMKKGRLTVIGTSLRLKNKFGTGYRMTVFIDPENAAKCETYLREELPGVELLPTTAPGSLTVVIPRTLNPHLPLFFKRLDADRDVFGIHDMQLSLTTLEEVFLRIAAEDDAQDKDAALRKRIDRDDTRSFWLLVFGFLIVPLLINFFKYRKSPSIRARKYARWSLAIFLLIVAILLVVIIVVAVRNSGGGSTVAAPTTSYSPSRPAAPGAWEPSGTVSVDAFPLGVQVGDVSTTGAVLSVRTAVAAVSVRMVAGVSSADGALAWGTPVALVSETAAGGAASGALRWPSSLDAPAAVVPISTLTPPRISISGLAPNTAYSVVVYNGSSDSVRSSAGRFWTAVDGPAPSTTAETGERARKIVFGATTMLGPQPVFTPWTSLGWAAQQPLDFFLLLGDTIQLSANSSSAAAATEAWRTAYSTEGLVSVFKNTSVITTNGIGEDANLPVFQNFMPYKAGPGAYPSIYRKLSWSPSIDIIVIDGLSERTAEAYVSAEQLQWIIQTLANSSAVLKLVVQNAPVSDLAGVTNVPPSVGEYTRWESYPAQRLELLTALEAAAIPGLVWLSGGVPAAMVTRLTNNVTGIGNTMTEVISGAAGTAVNPAPTQTVLAALDAITRRMLRVNYNSFTGFELDPNLRTLNITFIDNLNSAVVVNGTTQNTVLLDLTVVTSKPTPVAMPASP